MNQGSTLFLRLALVGLGSVALLLGIFMIPAIFREWPLEFPQLANFRYSIVFGLITSLLAFWAALFYAFRLLGLIDQNKSFSEASVKTLQSMKYCAFVIAGLFMFGMPAVFQVAQADDAPGLILIVGAIFVGIPVTVAVFAGVCQRLFQNAIDLKSENDLTV